MSGAENPPEFDKHTDEAMMVPVVQRAYATILGITSPATGQEADLRDDYRFRVGLIRSDAEVQASGEALSEAFSPAIAAIARLSQALDAYRAACEAADKRAIDTLATMHSEADQIDPSMLDPRLFDQ
jgi:hypothetical protein